MGHAAVAPFFALQVRQHVKTWKRTLVAIELLSVFAVILVDIWRWQGRSTAGTVFTFGSVLLILSVGWIIRRETAANLGWRKLRYIFIPITVAVLKIVGDCFQWHIPWLAYIPVGAKIFGYSGWAWLQEVILNSYFALRLKDCFTASGRASIAAGVVFGACHAPNIILGPIALLWGTGASYLFLNYRQKNARLFYWLIAVHAAVGSVLMVCLPHLFPDWPHSMAVGPRCLPGMPLAPLFYAWFRMIF